MAISIFTGHGQLWLETCCRCKTPFAMDEATHTAANRGKESFQFYCPYGHSQHYVTGDSELDIMRRDRDRLKQQMAERDDRIKELKGERDHETARVTAYKGRVTRLKNRAAAGLCPCCNRHFDNLQRHIASKHKDVHKEDAA